MAWPARRSSHACLNPIVGRGRHVWPTYAGIVAGCERSDQVGEPIDIDHAVSIGINKYLAASGSGPRVPRSAESAIRLMDIPHRWEFRCNLGRVIGRTVVDQHDLVGWII